MWNVAWAGRTGPAVAHCLNLCHVFVLLYVVLVNYKPWLGLTHTHMFSTARSQSSFHIVYMCIVYIGIFRFQVQVVSSTPKKVEFFYFPKRKVQPSASIRFEFTVSSNSNRISVQISKYLARCAAPSSCIGHWTHCIGTSYSLRFRTMGKTVFIFRPSVILILIIIFSATGLLPSIWGKPINRPNNSSTFTFDESGIAALPSPPGAGLVTAEDARMLAEVAQQLVAEIEIKSKENARNEEEWIKTLRTLFS